MKLAKAAIIISALSMVSLAASTFYLVTVTVLEIFN
jgi:hypothetical protein